MYQYLLLSHSWWRWLVLFSLLVAIATAFKGLRTGSPFRQSDGVILRLATNIAGIQLLLGLALYVVSPLTRHFLSHFSEAVHQRELRFFGLEHITMMIIAVVAIEAGAARVRKQPSDQQKFKTMLYWLLAALFIILTSIPWSFSPFTARPLFRIFW